MNKTVNAVNIGVGLDVARLKRSMGLARAEIATMFRNLKASRLPIEKFEAEMRPLRLAMDAGEISQKRFAQAQEFVAKKYGIQTEAMRLQAVQLDIQRQKTEALAAAQKRQADDAAKGAADAKRRAAVFAQYEVDQARWAHRERLRLEQETNTRLARERRDYLRSVNHGRVHASTMAAVNRPQRGGIGGAGLVGLAGRFAGPAAVLGGAMYGAKEALRIQAEAESAQVSMEVLLRDAQKAADMMKQFRRLDIESPLGITDFQDAAKLLLGYGVAGERVIPIVESLSKVSMGNATRFYWLAKAYADSASKGRLMAQELNQMTNQGFNPLKYVAEATGKSVSQLMDQMADGKVSFDQLTEALNRATTGTGDFAKMNERMLNTSAGAYAKLGGSAKQLGLEVGEGLSPFSREAANVGTSLLNLMKLGGNTKGFLEANAQLARIPLLVLQGKSAFTAYHEKQAQWAKEDSDREAKIKAEIDAQTKAREESNRQIQIARGHLELMTQAEKEMRTHIERQNVARAEAARLSKFGDKIDAVHQNFDDISRAYKLKTVGERRLREIELEGLARNRDLTDLERWKAEEALRMQREIWAAEDRDQAKKDKEAQDKKDKESRERVKRDVEQMAERFRTPAQRLRDSFKEIRDLEKNGLDKATADRARMEAAENSIQERDGNIATTIAPALKAGSAEAYRFLMQRNEEANRTAEAQLTVQKELRDIGREQLAGINRLQPARRIN